jgi:hypothetical protein
MSEPNPGRELSRQGFWNQNPVAHGHGAGFPGFGAVEGHELFKVFGARELHADPAVFPNQAEYVLISEEGVAVEHLLRGEFRQLGGTFVQPRFELGDGEFYGSLLTREQGGGNTKNLSGKFAEVYGALDPNPGDFDVFFSADPFPNFPRWHQ